MGKLQVPTKVGIWSVQALIGVGAFGSVFLVRTPVKGDKKFGYAAMKVEKRKKCREDEVLRMEVWVLKKLQNVPAFCSIYNLGQTEKFTYVVMTLLGKPLDEIRRAQPSRRFCTQTTLRIGIQLMNAFRSLHEIGFIHRDVKPANTAPGHKRNEVLYLYDFGMARFIYMDESKKKLRPRRKKIPFRGTHRFCSVNAQKCMDQGRVDDIWSLLYSLVECRRRKLPWTGIKPRECMKKKETISDAELFKDCPPSFARIKEHLGTVGFADEPDYKSYMQWMNEDLKVEDPSGEGIFEWQRPGQSVFRIETALQVGSDPEMCNSVTAQTDESLFATMLDTDDEDEGGTEENDDTVEQMPSDKVILEMSDAAKLKQQQQQQGGGGEGIGEVKEKEKKGKEKEKEEAAAAKVTNVSEKNASKKKKKRGQCEKHGGFNDDDVLFERHHHDDDDEGNNIEEFKEK